MSDESPVSLACAVLTVSDTRSAGDDTSGNLLAQNLARAGHQCVRRDIVKDNVYQIRRILSDWIADPEV
ncbi:MAG: molybdenum cofactor biosynthesis protein, partial [Achromobacter sp.]|nr:molybdenum cofactor biosynthesis protein [Achromobacter sp.]